MSAYSIIFDSSVKISADGKEIYFSVECLI